MFVILHITIIFSVLSGTQGNQEKCEEESCNTAVVAPLIDDMRSPLTATLDMSKVNQKIRKFIEDAIDSKMTALVQTKLEDVLASLKLADSLKRYIEDLKSNLTLNITSDIEKIVQDKITSKTSEVRKGEIALSVCTSLSRAGHIEAVRRTICDGIPNGSCSQICLRQNAKWGVTPLSEVFQLYGGGQFSGRGSRREPPNMDLGGCHVLMLCTCMGEIHKQPQLSINTEPVDAQQHIVVQTTAAALVKTE